MLHVFLGRHRRPSVEAIVTAAGVVRFFDVSLHPVSKVDTCRSALPLQQFDVDAPQEGFGHRWSNVSPIEGRVGSTLLACPAG